MKHLEREDRVKIAPYDPEDVDAEFIPFLERINSKPFAVTMQCCIGHCLYSQTSFAPAGRPGRWGYLELLMTLPSASWLCQEIRKTDWLIVSMSKLWGGDGHEMPSYTELGNFMITFAWDAAEWPTPAEEICALMDRYHDADPVEPEHMLNVRPPVNVQAKRRPTPPKKRPPGRPAK